LRYAQEADLAPHFYPTIQFTPDSGSFLTQTRGRQLVRVDLATGKVLAKLGEPFGRYEGQDQAFSGDGRLLAVRRRGAPMPDGRTASHPVDYRTRLLLYAASDTRLLGQYEASAKCLVADVRSSLMFESDGASLWLLCGQSHLRYAEPREAIALHLAVPSLQLLEARPLPAGIWAHEFKLQALDGSVWLFGHHTVDEQSVVVEDLTHNRLITRIAGLAGPALGTKLTAQWMGDRVDGRRIVLPYCGLPEDAPELPARPQPWRGFPVCAWLIFDTRTGALIERANQAGFWLPADRDTIAAPAGLRVRGVLPKDSKRGELLVEPRAAGPWLQRLETVAQRPLGISPDGRWLVAYAPDQRRIRIYHADFGAASRTNQVP
jgi:hypothetical protein